MNLLQKVSLQIKPDNKVIKEADEFVKKINKEIKLKKIKAISVAGGSIAKGTFLKNDHDVDIFVKFDYSCRNKDISKLLGNILKKLKPELVHGSRDYYQIKNKLTYEIIPVLDIKKPEMAVNVTDMSPLHVSWVKKFPKYLEDIRLAKQFCKSIKVYGAESYIKGFSGHVLDILVIYYKGFLNLLKNSQNWKKYTVIDFYNVHKGNALRNLNRSKISHLIVIDPIQPKRNAAAALSEEKINIFKEAAGKFLIKQSEDFFIKKEFTIDEIKRKYKNYKIVFLVAIPKEGKTDVSGAKLLKAFEHIKKHISLNRFTLINSDWKWDKEAIFYFVLKKETLPISIERVGPPLHEKKHVENFKKKHKKTFTKKDRVYAKVKRNYRKVDELIKNLIKDEYIKEKVKKVKII